MLKVHQEKNDEVIQKFEERLSVSEEAAVGLASDVVKNSYELLSAKNHIVYLEKAVHSGLQHGRKWNIEVDGIPNNIGEDPKQLELAALEILNAINVECESEDIEAIHRLPSRAPVKPVIIRLRSRKTVEAAFENKGKLKNLSTLNLDLAGINNESAIYIRPSLCPYYKNLAYNCRQLRKFKQVQNTIVSDDGSVKIKTFDNMYIKITHEKDLTSRFPDFENFNFISN